MNRKTTLVLRMVPVGLLASTIMVAGCVAPAVGGAGAAAFNRGTGSADRADEVRAAAADFARGTGSADRADEVRAAAPTSTRSGRDDWYLIVKPAGSTSGGLSPDERGAAAPASDAGAGDTWYRHSSAPDSSFPKTAIPR